MSAVAQAPAGVAVPAAGEAPSAAAARVRPVRVRRLSTSGLIWMVVLTVLLGGLVALNVAALRTTIAVSGVNTKVQHLQQQNRLERSRIGALSTVARITRKAESYGMRQSAPPAADQFSIGPQNPITPPASAAANPG